jgi:hypothetical protein
MQSFSRVAYPLGALPRDVGTAQGTDGSLFGAGGAYRPAQDLAATSSSSASNGPLGSLVASLLDISPHAPTPPYHTVHASPNAGSQRSGGGGVLGSRVSRDPIAAASSHGAYPLKPRDDPPAASGSLFNAVSTLNEVRCCEVALWVLLCLTRSFVGAEARANVTRQSPDAVMPRSPADLPAASNAGAALRAGRAHRAARR